MENDNNLENILKEINKAFDDFECMQEKHCNSAKESLEIIKEGKTSFPELQWNYEREKAFNILKDALNQFQEKLNGKIDYIDMFKNCKKRLEDIIKKEDQLKNFIEELCDKLKANMERIKHGKKALAGYGKVIT